MTMLTLAIGTILTLTGVVAYIVTDASSITSLIPSFVGVLLLVAGFISRNAKLHRHAIHAALALALLGILGSAMNVAQIGSLFTGTAERPGAVITSTIMFVLLLVLLIAGIRSFVQARRWKAQPDTN